MPPTACNHVATGPPPVARESLVWPRPTLKAERVVSAYLYSSSSDGLGMASVLTWEPRMSEPEKGGNGLIICADR